MPEDLEYENYAVNRMEKMARLYENPDFKELFIDGYMTEDMIQLGHNFGSNPSSRSNIAEDFVARSKFKSYIDGIFTEGVSARKTIIESQMEGDE
jgi:hypothetical protein